jgi:magnesium-transporting ATPase (P-type)
VSWKTTHHLVDALLFAVAVAVGLIPQLLPAIINSNLARGAFVLAKKNAIVKCLTSIRRWPIVQFIAQMLTSLRKFGRHDRSLQ